MTIDEAVARQWLRDNRHNLAWSSLSMVDPGNLDHTLNWNYETVETLVDSELGEGTYNNYKTRNFHPDEQQLGIKRCEYCHEMIADPVDSAKADGKLCRGCMRWYNACPNHRADLELEWQVWKGRTNELYRMIKILNDFQDKQKQEAEERWNKLMADIKRPVNKVKHIKIESNDEDYQRAIDNKLSFGEDWRNL